jgi:catechol 2,3-dioxygenase-like lactoylglutathione lyase family enzyme
MNMNLTLSTCFVLVHDPEVALSFYRDTLGLELRNDVAREDFRWITVGAVAQPGVAIVLTNYLNGGPADRDALAALLAKGALNGVHFHADDLDRPAVGHTRLCRARPVRQHGAHRPAARRLIATRLAGSKRAPRNGAGRWTQLRRGTTHAR